MALEQTKEINERTEAMSALEQIIAHGNRGLGESRWRTVPNNKIRCADGFTPSVVAGAGTYCRPRPSMLDDAFVPNIVEDVIGSYGGPYTHVEVGFPSARPEPWGTAEHSDPRAWRTYCDGATDRPTETVYGYVPVEMVRELIASHGGEA